jgi:nicotinate-nucleotide pyrophosphorylase (carboxylating)
MFEESTLRNLIQNALAEDIGSGDHSTLASIPPTATGKAVLKI